MLQWETHLWLTILVEKGSGEVKTFSQANPIA